MSVGDPICKVCGKLEPCGCDKVARDIYSIYSKQDSNVVEFAKKAVVQINDLKNHCTSKFHTAEWCYECAMREEAIEEAIEIIVKLVKEEK